MKLKEIRVDGYKNLIDCKIPLGDFNVLVGPNNSGKSNLLEVLTVLTFSCFGDEKMRLAVFNGYPARAVGSSICHLEGYKNKPMQVGITLELNIKSEKWLVQYDATIQCDEEKKDMGGFIGESLKAKKTNTTGIAKNYIKRQEKVLEVCGKKHPISKSNSSFIAIKTFYPDYEGLPEEFLFIFISVIETIFTHIFAMSPEGLRYAINEATEFDDWRVTSFDLLEGMEKIKAKNESHFKLLKETFCHVLDLEDMEFSVQEIPIASKEKKDEDTLKRVRSCYIKRVGSGYAPIEEFSDGTLMVLSILAALLSEERGGPIFCLEELENCLHPAAVEKLLRFMQEHADRWPVLLTTHSPYIVNGVKPADVIVAVVDETGATHFEKIKDRKALNNYLKSGYMSFGDLMATNFEEVLGGD